MEQQEKKQKKFQQLRQKFKLNQQMVPKFQSQLSLGIVKQQKKKYSDNFEKKYDLLEYIGEGTTAIVKGCKLKKEMDLIMPVNFELVAKIMRYRDIEYYFEVLREVMLLQQLKHPYIPEYFDALVDNQTKTVYLVQEKCKGITLTNYLKQNGVLSEYETMQIMEKVLNCLLYLQSKNICHRDLTLDNIMYDKNKQNVKVLDFSVAKELKNSNIKMWTKTGKIHYQAPEVFSLDYDLRIDLWSAGIVFYTLLVGQFPFNSKGNFEHNIVKSILKKDLDLNKLTISDPAKDLITQMLQKDPSKRISVEQALTHSWFSLVKAQKLIEDKRMLLQQDNCESVRMRTESLSLEVFTLRKQTSMSVRCDQSLIQCQRKKKKKSTHYICQSFSTMSGLQNEQDLLLIDQE